MASVSVEFRGIEAALRRVEEFKTELKQKCERLEARLAEEVASIARQGFNSAGVDDLVSGGVRPASVTVTANADGIGAVVAFGADAIWVEFGAGVFHNGSVGDSPHPQGAELGMTIGGYGQGRGGKQEMWLYKDESSGELRWTHGTPTQMPMYRAAQEIATRFEPIVKEVFGS